MSCYMQKTRWSLPCPWGNRYWRWEPPKSRWRRISHTRTCETQKPKHPQSLRARWRRLERTPAPPALQKPTEVQSSAAAARTGEQEMQWYQWLTKPRPQVQVSRMTYQCTADWRQTDKGGAARRQQARRPPRVPPPWWNAPTGCRCVLAAVTCCWCAWDKSGQQLPPLTNHHPPPPNQGRVHSTSGRSQTKHEPETRATTTETPNGLWHTDCGILTAMIPWICHINTKRKAWWLGLLSLLKRWFCCWLFVYCYSHCGSL